MCLFVVLCSQANEHLVYRRNPKKTKCLLSSFATHFVREVAGRVSGSTSFIDETLRKQNGDVFCLCCWSVLALPVTFQQ